MISDDTDNSSSFESEVNFSDYYTIFPGFGDDTPYEQQYNDLLSTCSLESENISETLFEGLRLQKKIKEQRDFDCVAGVDLIRFAIKRINGFLKTHQYPKTTEIEIWYWANECGDQFRKRFRDKLIEDMVEIILHRVQAKAEIIPYEINPEADGNLHLIPLHYSAYGCYIVVKKDKAIQYTEEDLKKTLDQIDDAEKILANSSRLLSNEQFLSKAKPEVVLKTIEQQTYSQNLIVKLEITRQKIQEYLEKLDET